MQRVVVALFDTAAEARLLHALGDSAAVTLATDGRQFHDLLARPRFDILIVSARVGVLAPMRGMIHEARLRDPKLAVCLSATSSDLTRASVLSLLEHDADGVIIDPVARLSDAVISSIQRPLTSGSTELVIRAIEPRITSDLRPFLEALAGSATQRTSCAKVAAAVGVARRTIAYRLTRAGLPPANQIRQWCRLLATSYAMEHESVSIEQAVSDFWSPTGLRNALDRLAPDLGPRALRYPGTFAALLDRFGRAISEGSGPESGGPAGRDRGARGHRPARR